MHPLVFHNKKVLPIEKVRLSPGQGGLLSGWGLFTTLRIYKGHPFAFERHWKRLENDSQRSEVPLRYEREQVREHLYELIAANQVVEGAVRVYFVRNHTGFWSGDESFPDVDLIMTSAGLPAYSEAACLDITEHGRYSAGLLCGAKVTSWLLNVWSLDRARGRGFDEVILLNERGEVAECTAANVFCVRGGKISTPPIASGCLAGVTRAVLLEIAPKTGLEIREQVLKPEDLKRAEEIFISSTTREVLPVRRIENHDVPAVAGPVTKQLEKAFSEYVRQYIENCEQARAQAGARGQHAAGN